MKISPASSTLRALALASAVQRDGWSFRPGQLSWALRALVVHDPEAVEAFLVEHEDVLAARVKREVRNKLTTGLKNPKK